MEEKDEKMCFLMKHLPDNLKHEYEYWVNHNPDIPEIIHPLINISDTLRAYFIIAHYFTDQSSSDEVENMLVGIRSIDLLASALGRQITSFGGVSKYTSSLDICATLFFGMVKNHAFSDGNKRTALLILLYQLSLYGYVPTAHKSDFEKLVLCVADNSLSVKYRKVYKKFTKQDDPEVSTLSYLLKRMVIKKNHTYHVAPTMKEFCEALENLGVKCKQENGKIHFSYKKTGIWKVFKSQSKRYAIPFGGMTRVVGPKTARDVLQNLGIYDEFASYQDVLDGKEPMYELVDNFKGPLRRLKDE